MCECDCVCVSVCVSVCVCVCVIPQPLRLGHSSSQQVPITCLRYHLSLCSAVSPDSLSSLRDEIMSQTQGFQGEQTFWFAQHGSNFRLLNW